MSDIIDRSRRDLIALSVLAAVGWRQGAFAAGEAANAPPPAPLSELSYGQVQLGEGPLARQARENHRLVLGLDEDALLNHFACARAFPHRARNSAGGTTPTPSRPAPPLGNG